MQALVFAPPKLRWPAAKLAGWLTSRALAGPLAGLRLVDLEPPALPAPDWVRLRTLIGGVCGTDLALVALRNHPATILQRFASFPAVLGHEAVALIDEVGPGVRGWRVGQRVCIEPSLACAARAIEPPCRPCAAGRTSLCENSDRGSLPPGLMIGLNTRTGGSWSPFFVAHESQLFAVPDGLPDDQAVLTDPLACAAHAVIRRPPEPREVVLVNGGGIIGLGVIAAIRALECANRVVAVLRHDFQADLARRLGADQVQLHRRGASHAERYADLAEVLGARRVPARFGNQALVGGFDLVYDCVGSGRSLTDAMKWTAARGTVVAVGTSQICVVDTTPLWFTELNVLGCNGRQIEEVNGRRLHTYELIFEWLRAGRLDPGKLPVQRFPLAGYRKAFDTLLGRRRQPVVKVGFAFD